MPSNADYAAMAYCRGNRDPEVVRLVEEESQRERRESAGSPDNVNLPDTLGPVEPVKEP